MGDVILKTCQSAKNASLTLATLTTEAKNLFLTIIADELVNKKENILAINNVEVNRAVEQGATSAFIERLKLTEKTIIAMAESLHKIAALPEPVGKTLASWTVPNGLIISRVSMPLGVILVVYEARPNVTIDAAALCIKAGNAVILRGGSECADTNRYLVALMQRVCKQLNIDEATVQYVPSQDRESLAYLLKQDEYIDVVVPRGGKNLIEFVLQQSRIPAFRHLEGICHTYVHEKANQDLALTIVHNAKLRRTGICGATETLLVDAAISKEFLPKIINNLIAAGCEIRGDTDVQKSDARVIAATEQDWHTEYLAPIISIKVVKDLVAAVEHINHYGSSHTEAIITEDKNAADQFFKTVNSAIVMHNTSTQFADGGEFGMGAEIGIATGKLHARGPVGIEQLTTFKYIVEGQGHIRS